MKSNIPQRVSNWFRRKVISRKYYLARRFIAKLFGLDVQLNRVYDLPEKLNHILIMGRGSSLNQTIEEISLDDVDLIIFVNDCDYLLTSNKFKKIFDSKIPIIQYLNNSEPVHSLIKTKSLNLFGFWLSVPMEDNLWREGYSKRRFRGPESFGAIPRYASKEVILQAEKFMPLNAGLLVIIQAIFFHSPKKISLAGFDFYKNKGEFHVDNAFLEKHEPEFLKSLSDDFEKAYLKIVEAYKTIQFKLFSVAV